MLKNILDKINNLNSKQREDLSNKLNEYVNNYINRCENNISKINIKKATRNLENNKQIIVYEIYMLDFVDNKEEFLIYYTENELDELFSFMIQNKSIICMYDNGLFKEIYMEKRL